MSSVRAMLAIWAREAAEPRIELMFEGIPRQFGQAVYINAAATGSTPSTFFGRGWPDTGGVAPSAVGMEMRSDNLLALPSRRWIEYGVRLHDICGFRTDRAPLWLAVVGSTILAFLFNFFSYGGLVFGNTSYRLFPRFLAFYTSLGGLNFLLLRSLTSGGLGPLSAQALLLPVLAVGGFAGMRIFVFRRAKPDVPA